MPKYDYICQNCNRRVRLFFSYAEYGQKQPECPHCQSHHLKRLIGRIALGKSEASRMDSVMDDTALANLDENDPRSIGQFMRRMGQEVDEDLGDDFSEVVERLESGESPESIEKSMPDLTEPAD